MAGDILRPRLNFQRLPLTPDTLHADWQSEPSPTTDAGGEAPFLEITFVKEAIYICARQHHCTSRPLWSNSIMLTTSACDVLHITAADEVAVVPIRPSQVQVRISTSSRERRQIASIVISSALATSLDVGPEDSLLLCPSTYTPKRANVRASITRIAEDLDFPALHCVWLSPHLAAALGIKTSAEIFLYQPPLPSPAPALTRVLQHPGFCYLSADNEPAFAIKSEDVLEMRGRRTLRSFAQVHLIPKDNSLSGASSYLDPAVADDLRLAQTGQLSFKKRRRCSTGHPKNGWMTFAVKPATGWV